MFLKIWGTSATKKNFVRNPYSIWDVKYRWLFSISHFLFFQFLFQSFSTWLDLAIPCQKLRNELLNCSAVLIIWQNYYYMPQSITDFISEMVCYNLFSSRWNSSQHKTEGVRKSWGFFRKRNTSKTYPWMYIRICPSLSYWHFIINNNVFGLYRGS